MTSNDSRQNSHDCSQCSKFPVGSELHTLCSHGRDIADQVEALAAMVAQMEAAGVDVEPLAYVAIKLGLVRLDEIKARIEAIQAAQMN